MRIYAEDATSKLTMLARNVDKSGTMPALQSILIESIDGKPRATSTNTVQTMRATINGEGQEDEKYLLPAAEFAQIVSSIGGGDVLIEDGDKPGIVVVSAEDGSSTYRIMALPVGDFPDIDRSEFEQEATIRASDLGEACSLALTANAKKDHRRVLLGVNLASQGGETVLTSTDGKKLVYRPIAISFMDYSGTLPEQVCQFAAKLRGESDILVKLAKHGISISDGEISLESQLIDGKFPDISAIIPKDRPIKATGEVDAILKAIKRASPTTDDRTSAVVVTMKPEGAGRIESSAHSVGNYNGPFPVESNSGITVAFSANHLSDILGNFPHCSVRFEAKSERSPWLMFFSRNGKELPGYCLLMPIALADTSKQKINEE